jgi:hypothetical protein
VSRATASSITFSSTSARGEILLKTSSLRAFEIRSGAFSMRWEESFRFHAGDITAHETPSELLKERFADAADTVLIEQVGAETGDELLAPGVNEDDPIVHKGLSQRSPRTRNGAE